MNFKCAKCQRILSDKEKGKRLTRFYSMRYSVKLMHNNFEPKCSLCGWSNGKGIFGGVEVAHIKAVKDGGQNNLENLVVLCPNCHKMFDRGMIPIEIILKNKNNFKRAKENIKKLRKEVFKLFKLP